MSASPGNRETPPGSFEFDALERARNYRAALMREFAPVLRGLVLEVGAGVGHISACLRQVPGVTQVVAVEPDARFHARLAQVLPAVDIIAGSLRDVPAHPWNAIVCVNVLEHIEDDAVELARMAELLRPERGHLCLFVPARPELYAPIDRDFGHFRRYRRPELRARLEQAGFNVLRLNYFNSVGYLIWWLNFKTFKKREFEPAKVTLFDRVLFPVIYFLESRLIRPPLGQSLIAIARAGDRASANSSKPR